MGLIFLFAFIAIPLIEIGLFIQVGGFMGMWPTILVVLLTAIIGTALLKRQGMNALNRLQQDINAGKPPLAPVFDGFCLLAAGFLLLTPGFFTDGVGFLLLIPPLRTALRGFLGRRINVQHSQTFSTENTQSSQRPDDVMDGEWQDVTPDERPQALPKKKNPLD